MTNPVNMVHKMDADIQNELWAWDVNRYDLWLRIGDRALSINTIETAQKTLNDIRKRWPTQQHIFDQMDRET